MRYLFRIIVLSLVLFNGCGTVKEADDTFAGIKIESPELAVNKHAKLRIIRDWSVSFEGEVQQTCEKALKNVKPSVTVFVHGSTIEHPVEFDKLEITRANVLILVSQFDSEILDILKSSVESVLLKNQVPYGEMIVKKGTEWREAEKVNITEFTPLPPQNIHL